MNVRRVELTIASSATGDAPVVYSEHISGRILSVHLLNAGASAPLATTVAVTLKSERTQQTIWAETLTVTGSNYNRNPRQLNHSSAGVVSTTGAGEMSFFYVGNERLTCSATACGNSKSAVLVVLTEG